MHKRQQPKGEILVMFMLLMGIGLILAVSLLSLQNRLIVDAKRTSQEQDAEYLSEAGIDKGYKAYLASAAYTGETLSLGNGTITTSITAGSTTNEKILSSVATVGSKTRKLRTTLYTTPSNVAVNFNYGMQAGAKGFSLGNGSKVNGNVYSNGNITGGSGSQITGSAFAVGTITGVTVSGQKKPGQPAQPLPTFDAAFWKGKAQAGGTVTGNYTPASGSNIGPLYITGNLIVNNSATLTVKGPVYVEGSITYGNAPTIKVDNALGSDDVMLITAGAITFGNTINIVTNTSGGHLLIVSLSTSDTAISIGNSAGTINAPLYAPNGVVSIGNNTHAVAVTGSGISAGNNTIVDYDSGLANSSFTTGPGGTWLMKKGSFQEY